MIITITGATGSGKSAISSYLCELDSNIIYLDLDKIGHLALEKEEVKIELIQKLSIKLHDGKIDRKELASIVFNDKEKLKILTEISWRTIFEEVDKTIKNNADKIILIDGALIPNTKYFNMSNLRILVKADFDTRMERAIKRDDISKDKFIERNNSALKFKDEDYDYVINNIDLEETKKVVKRIYDESIISR